MELYGITVGFIHRFRIFNSFHSFVALVLSCTLAQSALVQLFDSRTWNSLAFLLVIFYSAVIIRSRALHFLEFLLPTPFPLLYSTYRYARASLAFRFFVSVTVLYLL